MSQIAYPAGMHNAHHGQMQNDGTFELSDEDLPSRLDARFGVTMSTQEVAQILKMSVAALRMARSRKLLPLDPIPIDGRRDHIYSTVEVGRFLRTRLTQRGENPM